MTQAALLIHLLGVIFWIGGAATAAWAGARLALAPTETRSAGLSAASSAMLTLVTPALLLAWLGGLAMLVSGWSDVYAHAGWMHAKLTIALVLSALTGVLSARVRKAAKGEVLVSTAFFGGLCIAIVLTALVALVLVVLRPF